METLTCLRFRGKSKDYSDALVFTSRLLCLQMAAALSLSRRFFLMQEFQICLYRSRRICAACMNKFHLKDFMSQQYTVWRNTIFMFLADSSNADVCKLRAQWSLSPGRISKVRWFLPAEKNEGAFGFGVEITVKPTKQKLWVKKYFPSVFPVYRDCWKIGWRKPEIVSVSVVWTRLINKRSWYIDALDCRWGTSNCAINLHWNKNQ